MPAYHSSFNSLESVTSACGCSIVPLKCRSRGPAPPAPENEPDIVDESLEFFRANVLFTNFELQGDADKVLIYATLFIHLCLKKSEKLATKPEGARALQQIAGDSFSLPGDSGFPLGGMVQAPKNSSEKETIRGFLKQIRECVASRLIDRIYNDDGTRNKWWMLFAKRKFMNKELLR